MPQNPLAATIATNPSNQQAPAKLNSVGELLVNSLPALTLLDITAATVVKASPGRVGTCSVIVGGTGAGSINDCLTTAQVNVTNQIAVIPALATSQIGVFKVDMNGLTGIVVAPGTGQTVAISYE